MATIRLLACAEAGFAELEIYQNNAERWLLRMNEETRAMVASSIDESTGAAATEEGRRLTVDQAVMFALGELRPT